MLRLCNVGGQHFLVLSGNDRHRAAELNSGKQLFYLGVSQRNAAFGPVSIYAAAVNLNITTESGFLRRSFAFAFRRNYRFVLIPRDQSRGQSARRGRVVGVTYP